MGEVLLPGDTGYDAARTVWNAMVDRRPRRIHRCSTTRDVVDAVRLARELHLEVGVRCGGHSVVGHAVPEGGLMIDLTPMGDVQVDVARCVARVQGGALLGALDRASQRHGLATTAGNVSHTGVGGLVLGGGMGWLARQYGLSCDNVVSFEVVTADGTVLRASESEHPDLFWGLRGGGGNFGVVTEFELSLHPVGTQALSVELDFPADRARPVLRGWRDLSAGAPREATFTAAFEGDLVTIGFVWVGDPALGRAQLAPFAALGRPAAERVIDLSYLDVQQRDDNAAGHQRRRYWKGLYLRQLDDEVIDVLLSDVEPGVFRPRVSVQAYGGAIADVADEDTAFSHRDIAFELVAATGWADPAEDMARIQGTRKHAAVLDRFASGAYVNALNDEGAAGVGRAYPPHKLKRLTAVKDVYDPENFFRLNHNIQPSRRPAPEDLRGHTASAEPVEQRTPERPTTRHVRAIERSFMPNDVVTALARLLEDRYVFPDAAERIAKDLRSRAFPDGDPKSFADDVRTYLHTHDRHLSLIWRSATAPEDGPARTDINDPEVLRRTNNGVRQVTIHDGNVAVLDLTLLCDADQTAVLATYRAAMGMVARADAMIVDLRDVPGGWPSGCNLLLGHFLPQEPTHLLTMTRRHEPTSQDWTPRENPLGHRPDLPLFLVIDDRSASAAEALAYVAQSLGRATVVGRPSAGAANPADFFPIADEFTALIPTSAPIDPRTGTNWDVVGVQPDVLVGSGDALERALALARAALGR